jgi:hypothetical protein
MEDTLWMGVRPGPEVTRILVQEASFALLKARLPDAPHHPWALETLAEGVALWCGRALHVALGVVAKDALCVSPHWQSTVGRLTRTPLVTIEPPSGVPRSSWRVAYRYGLGDFRDVCQLRDRGTRS